MNLELYIGKKVKLNMLVNGVILTYTAIILSADSEQTVFVDKFDKEILANSNSIVSIEVVKE